jgi:putative NIF3 family GTP cyclohydrolase 1 type 2
MPITAQAIADRIQQKLGASWRPSVMDGFMAGRPDTEVRGVVTTFAPSLEVLRKAVASGQNMIVVRKPPAMDSDPTYQIKRDYIAANKLVVYRLFENWNLRQPDAQLQGLAKALGWEKHYKPSGGQPWATNNGFFALPPATLKQTAQALKKTLGLKSIRVGGDPNLRVTKAALSHGLYWLTDIHKLLAEPGVDLLVVGEPQWENELSQYSFDLADAGLKHGMIVLGQEASEEPGAGEMAAWLTTFVSEVPVRWIPTGEPSWMPY